MLNMTVLDWSIVGAVVTTTMLLGILVGFRSGKNRETFFLGGARFRAAAADPRVDYPADSGQKQGNQP